MKKIYTIMAVSAAALCFAACAKEEVPEVAKTTLFATIDEGSKACLTANGAGKWKTIWEENDVIMVGDKPFTIVNSTIGTGTAKFTGELPSFDGKYDVTYLGDFNYADQPAFTSLEGLKLPMIGQIEIVGGKPTSNKISFSATAGVLVLTVTMNYTNGSDYFTCTSITIGGNKAAVSSVRFDNSTKTHTLYITLPAGETFSRITLSGTNKKGSAVSHSVNTSFSLSAGQIGIAAKEFPTTAD